jgi:hypothetical protein
MCAGGGKDIVLAIKHPEEWELEEGKKKQGNE